MTTDANPPFTPLPASLSQAGGHLAGRQRLFPSRLGPARPRPRPEDMAAEEEGRAWLRARLWLRHAGLDRRIAEEAARPRPDAETLRTLKRDKLLVKDRIASLERRAS